MTEAFAGKVAIVTGSSHGIGRAVAATLIAHGAAVVVNGRLGPAVHETAEELGAVGVVGDCADPAVADELRDTTLRQFGGVDILITCTGIAEPAGSSILTADSETWQAQLRSHATATFEACRVIVPELIKRRGALVTSGSHAYLGMFGGTGYPAGKGAVVSLTHALAAELAEHHVRVNCVCPGAATRLSTGQVYEEHIELLHRRGVLDEGLRDASLAPPPAEHAAALYAYLASEAATGITGRVFVGSGGFVGELLAPATRVIAYRDADAHPPWSLPELAALIAPS